MSQVRSLVSNLHTMSSLHGMIGGLANPLLFGINISMILYGIFLVQVVYYWTTYERDNVEVKVCVCLLLVLETCHTVVCLHLLYFYLVLHYGDFQNGITQIVWSAGTSIYLEISIMCVTESFYLYRIWHLSGRNRTVTAITSIPVLTRLGIGIYSNMFVFTFHTWQSLKGSKKAFTMINATWALSIAADLSVVLVLLYYLYRNRRAGFGRTRRIMRGLSHYSLSTGVLTLVCSLAVLITFNTNQDTMIYGGFLEVLSKLYANSVLAMLNARQLIVSNAENGFNNTLELSRLHYVPSATLNSLKPSDGVHATEERIQLSDHTLSVETDKKGGGSIVV
ncbi:hypothetical protein BDW22DRAFT_1430273 [Trametopsis cervina]|nr:hypothetical protein BDW22DRAFT_1430273 [Trametopsis cervina]